MRRRTWSSRLIVGSVVAAAALLICLRSQSAAAEPAAAAQLEPSAGSAGSTAVDPSENAATSASPRSAAGPAASTAPILSDAELDAKLSRLLDANPAARRAAVTALASLGPESEATVIRKLASFRKIDDAALYEPVRQGRGSDPGGDDLAQSLASYGHLEHASQVRALDIAALLGAAAHIATTPALREMIAWTGPASGVFRPDITRRIKALGDRAVPALIEGRKDPSPDVRRWSFGELESLGKRVPGDAVQTKDNQVLADTLEAFGKVHDIDAIAVILSFVNSDRLQVRTAARAALATYGQDAVWKLREAYANLVGKSAPETWSADQIAKELFAAYDRFRLEDVYALLEDGLAAQKDGKNEDAVASFDKVLARQPMLDRRAEMVPAYTALGMAIHESDRPRARALLRKAERLDPGGTRAGQIEAELTVLEGMDLLARGIADEDLFQRALKLDPSNAEARRELDRLAEGSEVREERTHRWAAGGALFFVALAGIILFGGRRNAKPGPRGAAVS